MRFYYFLASKLWRKPFLAWTQSYGPFSTPLTRFLAKLDLGSQPLVFCRGEDCRAAVKGLLPQKSAESFPDVAVALDYSREWGEKYIHSKFGKVDFQRLITVSPSAVIHSKTSTSTGGSTHVIQVANLCRYLIERGYYVLLVPHTYRPNRHDPRICDYGVATLVMKELHNVDRIGLVEDDLSPIDLKSMISTAHIHVGARYHSIVAALSSGVPCISLSWHPKYKDLMRMYGVECFVYDSVSTLPVTHLYSLFEILEAKTDAVRDQLKQKQSNILKQIKKNTLLFVDLLERSL